MPSHKFEDKEHLHLKITAEKINKFWGSNV